MKTLSLCIYGIYACVAALFAKYNINVEALAIIVVLLVFDIIIGIAKSYVLYSEKDPARFSRRKMVVGLLGKGAMIGGFLCVSLVMGFYGADQASEMRSSASTGVFLVAIVIGILQNVIMTVSKKEIEQRDAISFVFDKILDVFRAVVEKRAGKAE